jgi:hypothetical protein
LQKQWEGNCQTFPLTQENDLQKAFDRDYAKVGQAQSGAISDSDTFSNFTVSSYVNGAKDCPGGINIPVFGQLVSVDMGWLCGYLALMAVILKGMAWLFVGRLMVTAI